MVPAEHLGKGWGDDEEPLGASHRSDVLRARQIAYETFRVTGGSIINPRNARQILQEYAETGGENYADPTISRGVCTCGSILVLILCFADHSVWVRARAELASAPEIVRKLVCPEEPEDPLPAFITASAEAKL